MWNRGLSLASNDELMKGERSQSVVGLASYWVAMEFLAHAAELTDRAYGSPAAIRRLWRHCTKYDQALQGNRIDGQATWEESVASLESVFLTRLVKWLLHSLKKTLTKQFHTPGAQIL